MTTDLQTKEETPQVDKSTMRISITKDGPYIVSGNIPLKEKIITPADGHKILEDGKIFEHAESYALCRCGHSKIAPFCDGSHVEAHFNGTETASRSTFHERAEVFDGPEIDLLDDNRCAFARFCHRPEGDVWSLTELSDDEHLKNEAIIASTECPAGRLVHVDKEGNEIEPEYDPEILVLQDPENGVSAALFVKGKVPLESVNGQEYEIRNRYALCRCGSSRNKPFCDASHVPAHFVDQQQ